jgi:hypothetical protein
MSSPQVQNTIVAAPVKEKKPRKPTLAAKYSKVVIANYSIIQMLKSKGLLTDEAVETAYSEVKLFDSVEDQSAFYESFIDSLKDTGKTMKKFVTQRLKPPKAPRAKKETKPRAKKETKVVDDTKIDVVAQLVEAANAPMSPPRETQVHLAPDAPKKAKKPRAKKEKVAAIPLELRLSVNEGIVEVAPVEVATPAPVKEKKARKPRAKKEVAPVPVVAAPVPEEEEEEEEIHTQEIVIGNKTYLIDGENNIYSVDTHDHIGTFDSDKNVVVEIAN